MDGTPAPSSCAVIKHLRPIATLQDSLGHDLQTAELYSAIKHLETSELPPAGSDDAKRLGEPLEELEGFLDGNGYRFLAKELHDLRLALDE